MPGTCSQWVEAVFFAVPPMEPLTTAHQHPADLQLAATIAAWEAECAAGWIEPAPVDLQGELSLPAAADQGLLGSAWDSWSSNPYLEQPQVEEQPGFAAFEPW
ncbi:MAG: hypothetical protein QUV07_04695 [Cyanobium sp. CZS 25K]|nr:hypothetical protein [Cyanobium sp. CZS25K]